MTTTPAKERKAKERELKRAQGLIRVEVWVMPEDREQIKTRANELNEARRVVVQGVRGKV